MKLTIYNLALSMLFLAISVTASAQSYLLMDDNSGEISRIHIDSKHYTKISPRDTLTYPVLIVALYDVQPEQPPVATFYIDNGYLDCVTIWRGTVMEHFKDDNNNFYDILSYLDYLNQPAEIEYTDTFYEMIISVTRSGLPPADTTKSKF